MQSNPNRSPVSPIAALRRVGFAALHWPTRRARQRPGNPKGAAAFRKAGG